MIDDYFYHERNIIGKITNNYKGKENEFINLRQDYKSFKTIQLTITGTDQKSIFDKTDLLISYFNLVDKFMDKNKEITTQSKLRSTILEEFCGYLFKDVPTVTKLALNFYNKKIFAGIAIDSDGKVYPKTKDVDFCIGKKIKAKLENREFQIIIPLIAIECKTWLDKTMFSEAQFTAQKLKQGTPYVKVYIVSGYSGIKKNEIPHKGQTPIDQIFLIGDTRVNIDKNAVWEFFEEVKNDLSLIEKDVKISDVGKLLPD